MMDAFSKDYIPCARCGVGPAHLSVTEPFEYSDILNATGQRQGEYRYHCNHPVHRMMAVALNQRALNHSRQDHAG